MEEFKGISEKKLKDMFEKSLEKDMLIAEVKKLKDDVKRGEILNKKEIVIW